MISAVRPPEKYSYGRGRTERGTLLRLDCWWQELVYTGPAVKAGQLTLCTSGWEHDDCGPRGVSTIQHPTQEALVHRHALWYDPVGGPRLMMLLPRDSAAGTHVHPCVAHVYLHGKPTSPLGRTPLKDPTTVGAGTSFSPCPSCGIAQRSSQPSLLTVIVRYGYNYTERAIQGKF